MSEHTKVRENVEDASDAYRKRAGALPNDLFCRVVGDTYFSLFGTAVARLGAVFEQTTIFWLSRIHLNFVLKIPGSSTRV